MYSSSNNDFVRGTVTDFYEMFNQQSDNEDDENEDLSAFSFNNSNFLDIAANAMGKVCPLDDMEVALKLRNEAVKQKCSAVQINHLKTILMMVRTVVDTIVSTFYILIQILLGLFRMLIPGMDASEVIAELEFWFLKLIGIAIEAIKQVVNMLFRMLFNWGEFGKVMRDIIQASLLHFLLENLLLLTLLCKFSFDILTLTLPFGCCSLLLQEAGID